MIAFPDGDSLGSVSLILKRFSLMAKTRICFVGGGSYNWMPKLLGDLALTRDLEGSIVLHDLNPSALEDIQRYGRKAVSQAGTNFSIETTTDLERSLEGAEFVVVTITTGGLDTMAADLGIPEKYGIYQSVGDTVGPGGLSRALRNVPVLVGIARAMERIRNNFDKPLRIDSLARELGISASGLHHQFKTVTAMTPLQFQKQLRLQEARRLMLGEDLDAASAGYRVGYDDPSHFSREYKRQFGEPPVRDVERLRGAARG